MARSRRRFASRRARRPARWTAQLVANSMTGALYVGAVDVLVTSADYEQTATMEASGVTLARIRGELALNPLNITSFGNWWGYIAVFDEDHFVTPTAGASTDPTTFSTYVDEDILWTGMAAFGTGLETQRMHIDVKVKRRLANQRITLISAFAAGNTTDSLNVNGILRTLLVGG